MNQSPVGTDRALPIQTHDRGHLPPKIEPDPLQDIRPGDILAGKYRVERKLGQGGMGVVVAAWHLDLHEYRAIKLMLPDQMGSVAVERFLREARATVRLRTEHIAKVFDVGRLESGAPYMVMELLHGVDLADFLRNHGPMPIEDAVLCIFQACKALAEAHAIGIVHRDIKPSNLFLVTPPNGPAAIKVLDFGISKQLPIAGIERSDATGPFDVMGSIFYMSPEQMRSARDVDERTDVWALGAVLYKLITNLAPFRASTRLEVFAMVFDGTPCEPPTKHRPDLDPALERIILSCLEHDLAARMPSIIDLMTALEPFLPNQSIDEDGPTTLLVRPPRAKAERSTTRSAVHPELLNQLRREVGTEPFERPQNLRGLMRTVRMFPHSPPQIAAPRPSPLGSLPAIAVQSPMAPQAAPPCAPPWPLPLPLRTPTDWPITSETASPPSSASRTSWEQFPSSFPPPRMETEFPLRAQPSMIAAVNAWRANAANRAEHQPQPAFSTRRWMLTIGLLMAVSGVLMLGGAAALFSAVSPRSAEPTPPLPKTTTTPNPLPPTIPSASTTVPVPAVSVSPPPALSDSSKPGGAQEPNKPLLGGPPQPQPGRTTAVAPKPARGPTGQEIKTTPRKTGGTAPIWKQIDTEFAL